jgi:hypothetical protein
MLYDGQLVALIGTVGGVAIALAVRLLKEVLDKLK